MFDVEFHSNDDFARKLCDDPSHWSVDSQDIILLHLNYWMI